MYAPWVEDIIITGHWCSTPNHLLLGNSEHEVRYDIISPASSIGQNSPHHTENPWVQTYRTHTTIQRNINPTVFIFTHSSFALPGPLISHISWVNSASLKPRSNHYLPLLSSTHHRPPIQIIHLQHDLYLPALRQPLRMNPISVGCPKTPD